MGTHAGKYQQLSKYCERCAATTPHQLREQDGLIAKICVVCLLRGYLSGQREPEDNTSEILGRIKSNDS